MLLETGKAVRPASGRRARNVAACQEMHISLGQVRKAVDRQHWSARFQLRHEGKRLSFDAPMRVSKTDAETDRKFVEARLRCIPRHRRSERISDIINELQDASTNVGKSRRCHQHSSG